MDVTKLVEKHLAEKPAKIELQLDWENGRSRVQVGERVYELGKKISFTEFADSVKRAFEHRFGSLETIPVNFREEILSNDRVKLDLHPTGGAGIFEIFVTWK